MASDNNHSIPNISCEANAILHENLVQWITGNGGHIHENLVLHTPFIGCDSHAENDIKEENPLKSDIAISNYSSRGIFAKHGSISKGEELIRLPSRLALDGSKFPSQYQYQPPKGETSFAKEASDRNASPWLRCITSLIHAWHQGNPPRGGLRINNPKSEGSQQSINCQVDGSEYGRVQTRQKIASSQSTSFYSTYLESLPTTYDSLLNWSVLEVESFLRGTTLGTSVLQDIQASDANSPCVVDQANVSISNTSPVRDERVERSLHKRFEATVVPYLNYLRNAGYFGCEYLSSTSNEVQIDEAETGSRCGNENAKRQKVEVKGARVIVPEMKIGDDSPEHTNDMEMLYPLFRQACMCVSTRAFHMQAPTNISKPNEECNLAHHSGVDVYHGPYLLPYIDLINHAPQSSPKHATTLRRDPSDLSFVMIAERDIAIGEEVFHSYDLDSGVDSDPDGNKDESKLQWNQQESTLTSAQLLQTFGFVDVEEALRYFQDERTRKNTCNFQFAIGGKANTPSLGNNTTPALLKKMDICRICRSVASSSYPTELCKLMEKSGLLDEGWECWEMPLQDGRMKHEGNILEATASTKNNEETQNLRQRALDVLPNEIIVSINKPLTDELITICCLNFLPNDAIADLLCSSSSEETDTVTNESKQLLLGIEVLDDYFLGKLVFKSLLQVIEDKLELYKMSPEQVERNKIKSTTFSTMLNHLEKCQSVCSSKKKYKTVCWGDNEKDDAETLLSLISAKSIACTIDVGDLVHKFKCGMIISLEERSCLLELKKSVLIRAMDLDNIIG